MLQGLAAAQIQGKCGFMLVTWHSAHCRPDNLGSIGTYVQSQRIEPAWKGDRRIPNNGSAK